MSTEHIAQAHAFLASSVAVDRGERTEDPSDPATVQAMQIALHIPKTDPPRRNDLLVAAAQSVVAVCLAPEAVTDSQWHARLEQWYGHLIRKIARRGRNLAWRAVQSTPGITAQWGSAEARAFLPSAVSEVPTEVRKLQIQGTDLPLHEDSDINPTWPTIAVNRALSMTVGKAAAQVGHASMLYAARMPATIIVPWAEQGFPLNVVEAAPELFDDAVNHPQSVVVRDAGFTEIAPNSITTATFPPAASI
ncbi:peptidyl-tRNA hydrolase [Corynebacterium breve]|uniref:peptidyl-tRNA hydrolase n=1 Tax=Corynebacterium breve TaxID=3049799 RepID=A0ABY8VG63_9CORY|nr:peptidyl-tRNA hydrolase [Corynebacterium breve]WIM67263.1 peptidyl-tRNA hydrolase [Corynebacterium breve]